jgi:hypothetical protein
MSREDKAVIDAKKSLKAHIKFFESLLGHLRGNDTILKGRAMWATWCLHRYINDGLIGDIENAMKEHGENKNESH